MKKSVPITPKELTVSCPTCGAEYHMSELVNPNDICPQARGIAKDSNAKIISYGDADVIAKRNEYYRCDYCDKYFKVFFSRNIKIQNMTADEQGWLECGFTIDDLQKWLDIKEKLRAEKTSQVFNQD